MSEEAAVRHTDLTVQRRELQALQSSSAWAMITQVVQDQVDTLQNLILFGTVESSGDIYRLERMKGQLEGRLSLTRTMETLLENIEVDLNLSRIEADADS